MDQNGKDKRSFAQRYGVALAAGAAAVAVIAIAVLVLRNSDSEPTRKVQQITMVTLQPPPPPPPPPPPAQEQPQPKMIEQPKIKEPEVKQEKPLDKPKEAPPKPVEAPPTGPLGLDAKADGPGDSFNLAGNPGGNGLLGGGGGGSRWGWYASQVQTQIEEALRENKKTRNSRGALEVRLWADTSGRVTRVQLMSSTGDQKIDDAIKNEVLMGMKLRQAPPSDMPMPITARITERRPT